MAIRIICNRKIDLTNDEHDMYNDIVKSYDQKMRPDLFADGIFETDKNGMIMFLRPPSNKSSTLEIFLYFVAIMNQQQMRNNVKILENSIKDIKEEIKKIKNG